MGIASLMAIRKAMDEFYLSFKVDKPILARGCLEVIYWELFPDLMEDERKECKGDLDKIARLVNAHNKELSFVDLNKKNGRKVNKETYLKVKGDLWNAMREFYHTKLLVCMDQHDLLRPKKDDPHFAALE